MCGSVRICCDLIGTLKRKAFEGGAAAERHIQLPRRKCAGADIYGHMRESLTLAFMDRHRPGEPERILRESANRFRHDLVIRQRKFINFPARAGDGDRLARAVQTNEQIFAILFVALNRLDNAEAAIDPASTRSLFSIITCAPGL